MSGRITPLLLKLNIGQGCGFTLPRAIQTTTVSTSLIKNVTLYLLSRALNIRPRLGCYSPNQSPRRFTKQATQETNRYLILCFLFRLAEHYSSVGIEPTIPASARTYPACPKEIKSSLTCIHWKGSLIFRRSFLCSHLPHE